MFRKSRKRITYKSKEVVIRPASLGEEYEVGIWATTYPWVKMGYDDYKYEPKYSDITYVMLVHGEIVGYFSVYSQVNIKENGVVPLYRKELILYDFAVDIRAYAKYTKLLIDFMLKYAADNSYYAVTVHKLEKFHVFNKFINRHYKIIQIEDKYCFMIDNPRIRKYQEHLIIYPKDKVQLDSLYFLYDLNFNILKTKCSLKLTDNEKIIVDRLTGLIYFPSNVQLSKNQVILNKDTQTLIYLIVSKYHMKDIKPVIIDYDINNPNDYEANIGGLLHINKTIEDIRNDSAYANLLISKGYEKVMLNYFKYDMNDRSFSDSPAMYKLVK